MSTRENHRARRGGDGTPGVVYSNIFFMVYDFSANFKLRLPFQTISSTSIFDDSIRRRFVSRPTPRNRPGNDYKMPSTDGSDLASSLCLPLWTPLQARVLDRVPPEQRVRHRLSLPEMHVRD